MLRPDRIPFRTKFETKERSQDAILSEQKGAWLGYGPEDLIGEDPVPGSSLTLFALSVSDCTEPVRRLARIPVT